MKRSSASRLLTVAGAALLPLVPQGAHACAVCMGSDPTSGAALNGAIFLMLGCIGSMMALVLGVAYSFWRRSQAGLPPHAEFTDSLLEKP